MIRILLDECLDVKLKYRFQEYSPNFRVSTVTGQQWTGIKNGKLLTQAQQQFDVLVTIDQPLTLTLTPGERGLLVALIGKQAHQTKPRLLFPLPRGEGPRVRGGPDGARSQNAGDVESAIYRQYS